ncbi:MAG: YaaR family protein [Treponema sp.]|nr:YaaR family protein [Treponema sp.]
MNPVDQVNSSLYFSAVSSALSEEAKSSKKREKLENAKKTSAFSAILKKSQELSSLNAQGLPEEIAGMELEEALVFLKDRVTMAGDELMENQTDASFAKYKQSVTQLIKYIVKNTYQIEQHKTFRKKKTVLLTQVNVVNAKLDKLASEILLNQSDRLNMLKRVEEIQGLIIDMLAT